MDTFDQEVMASSPAGPPSKPGRGAPAGKKGGSRGKGNVFGALWSLVRGGKKRCVLGLARIVSHTSVQYYIAIKRATTYVRFVCFVLYDRDFCVGGFFVSILRTAYFIMSMYCIMLAAHTRKWRFTPVFCK